jgi:uncharacterized membrane protein
MTETPVVDASTEAAVGHPALSAHDEHRRSRVSDRLADRITRFSGSMLFVALHVAWFAAWIGFGAERYPFGLLTMIVSLEAIFLSTFVLISQNRADDRRQALADHEWRLVKLEEKQNEALLALTKEILDLTREIRDLSTDRR